MSRHLENARPRWETRETTYQRWSKLANKLHKEWLTSGNTQYVQALQPELIIPEQANPIENVPQQLAHVALNSNDNQ